MHEDDGGGCFGQSRLVRSHERGLQLSPRDALALIADAVPARPGVWADLGAGEGTFTRALIERLGPQSHVYAVDRNRHALDAVERTAGATLADVVTVEADFSRPFDLPGVARPALDGLLLANALHFVRDPAAVLEHLAAWLLPNGRLVIVEYDRRAASRWVPYPIPVAGLPELALAAGLSAFTLTAMRPSAFGGTLYAAFAKVRTGDAV